MGILLSWVGAHLMCMTWPEAWNGLYMHSVWACRSVAFNAPSSWSGWVWQMHRPCGHCKGQKKPNIFHSKILLWKKVRLMLMLMLISWDSDKIEKHWSVSELWSVQSWEEAVQWNHDRITDDHRACKNRVRLRLVARKAIVQQVRYVQWNRLLLFCDDSATRLLTYDDYASLAH